MGYSHLKGRKNIEINKERLKSYKSYGECHNTTKRISTLTKPTFPNPLPFLLQIQQSIKAAKIQQSL